MAEQTKQVKVVVVFPSPDSVDFQMHIDPNVNPLQLIAVATYLEMIAKSSILEARAAQMIATPAPPTLLKV